MGENDIAKINLAQINGYRVLQFTYQMLQRGEHLIIVEQLKLSCNALQLTQLSPLVPPVV